MSEEEKQAIEYLKRYKYQNEVSEAIETVLKLIENQQAEIKKKDETIDYLRSISRKEESIIDEEQDNVELQTLINKKDKVIDLMAEYIAQV